MNYEGLRAESDAEFGRLRTAVWELRLITQEPSSDKVAEEAARQRVDLALGLYRERRNNLADFLTSRQPVGKPAASVASPPLGVRTMRIDLRAAGSDDGAFGRRNEVRVLAYRLWEEVGCPIGRPDEHWYRAEEMLRLRQ